MLYEQFFMLHQKLAVNAPANTATEVTLEQIAETLYCTTRNAKLVIRKLEEKGWIMWKAGRGRGNRSKLTFLADQADLLQEAAQQLALKGEYRQAFELLRTYGQGIHTNDSYVEWMNGHFGFSKEMREGEAEARDSLRLPVYRLIETLDPAECYYSFQAHMIQQIFDRLVIYDNANDQYLPVIAHYWNSNEVGTVWTFHLRKGIRFHDGRELSAEDVKFTVERLGRDKRNGWIVRELQRVEAVSPREVRFILNKPNRIFIRFVSSICMSIVPKHLVSLNEELFWKLPVGTGPFQVEEWTDERLTIRANPHYYQGRPHLDNIHIIMMPEDAEHCEVSWERLLQDPERIEHKGEKHAVDIIESSEGCTTLITWNMKKPGPYQSIEFRRAFSLILNRAEMIRELGGNRLYPAKGFIMDEQAPYRKDRHDPELAKSLLKQSGYDGSPITMATLANHIKDAEWVQKQCASIGIPLIIREERMDTIHQSDVMNTMDCVLHGLVLPGEEVCLIENYEQKGSVVKEFMDPSLHHWVKDCVDDALASEWYEERLSLLSHIEERLREEAHVSFLVHTRFYASLDPSYKGVVINNLGWLDFKQIWRV
ncbi:ABC transporter substrate-binding protein [Paenibacillus sp. Dod16]|uniref:SgrR family transcriptional regulator n=1 Tax=Paenibacillus sp. Dod16 TaxID=3416392 RepID=UPI003CF2CBA9